MSVRADIYTETNEETLAVPVQAVLYDEDLDEKSQSPEDQPYVFVIENGKARRQDVKVGISSDSDQEILEGLSAEESVISGPFRVLRHLKEGDEVEIKDDSSKDEEDEDD